MKKLLLVAILLSATLGLSAPAFSGTYIADMISDTLTPLKCGSVTVSGSTMALSLNMNGCGDGVPGEAFLVCTNFGDGDVFSMATVTDTNKDGTISSVEGLKKLAPSIFGVAFGMIVLEDFTASGGTCGNSPPLYISGKLN